MNYSITKHAFEIGVFEVVVVARDTRPLEGLGQNHA